jgi:hypothetical protein
MARSRQRTAKSHPHELHETHDVSCGGQTFGKVGRFKHGKIWFMATSTTCEGKTYPAWYPEKYSCRAAAEQACFNRWLELHDLDVTGRANAKRQAEIQRANQAALDAENASAEKALRNASAEELAEALDDVLDGCNGRVYGGTVNTVKEKLSYHLSDLYIDDARQEIEDNAREEGVEWYREIVRIEMEPILRTIARAAYDDQLSAADKYDLRDWLAREYGAYSENLAKFL